MQQFTDKAKRALNLAVKAAKRLKRPDVDSEHILLGLALEGSGVAAMVLADCGADAYALEEVVREQADLSEDGGIMSREIYTPLAESILMESHALSERLRTHETGTEHILIAILKENDCKAVKALQALHIDIQRMMAQLLLAMGDDGIALREELAHRSKKKKGAVSMLSQYSRDLTALASQNKLDPVVGRENEIRRLIQIVCRRTKNNPCLIGEPGVGKTAIVEGLAIRIVAGDVPEPIQNKRLLTLDLSGMVAGSKYRGEFEERVKRVIREVTEAGNVLLFLDEIHTLIGAGGAEGSIDASSILKPSLARGEIQLIGATTISEYRKYIEKDAALERRFQPIMVEEPSVEEAMDILKGVVGKYEQHHHVKILPDALEAAVRLSERYINDRNLPDKAIDLIDEAAASVRLGGMKLPDNCVKIQQDIHELDMEMEKAIRDEQFEYAKELKTAQDSLYKKLNRCKTNYIKKNIETIPEVGSTQIEEIVSVWTKIPVKKLAEKESERLLKLEQVLHKRVIGQEEAVLAVSRAIRRGRVGLQDPNRPIGSFLFLGPTGVGKTELSKALAEAVFGSDSALIRVDMSEYMEQHSVSKMIGSPPGYVGFDEGGQLSEKIRRNPYSVVLFDEVEKAHPDVFNILLQVLDDGHITDSKGRKVSFKNTILIMTSNAGAQRIVAPKTLGFASSTTAQQDYEKMKSGVMEEVKRIFKPEFINRIDEIMVFHALTKEDMKRIIHLLTTKLSERCKNQMDITLRVTPAMQEHLVTKYSDLKMGARPLKRVIQQKVLNELS